SSIKVQIFGFQDQEDGELLESEERSVGTYYVSTEAFGSAPYSTPTKLQRINVVIKVGYLNCLFNKGSNIRLSGPRRWRATRKRGAQRRYLLREHRSFR